MKPFKPKDSDDLFTPIDPASLYTQFFSSVSYPYGIPSDKQECPYITFTSNVNECESVVDDNSTFTNDSSRSAQSTSSSIEWSESTVETPLNQSMKSVVITDTVELDEQQFEEEKLPKVSEYTTRYYFSGE